MRIEGESARFHCLPNKAKSTTISIEMPTNRSHGSQDTVGREGELALQNLKRRQPSAIVHYTRHLLKSVIHH